MQRRSSARARRLFAARTSFARLSPFAVRPERRALTVDPYPTLVNIAPRAGAANRLSRRVVNGCLRMCGGSVAAPCQHRHHRAWECRSGEVAEWFKAPVLKTGVGASLPWVRIPPSPPCFKKRARRQLLWQMQPPSPRPMFNRDFSSPAPLRLLWRLPGSFRRKLHPRICCTSRRTNTFRERPSRR